MSEYLPNLISHESRYRKRGKHGGPVKPPPCRYCPATATRRVHIKVSWFRGDDEVMPVCDAHRDVFARGSWPKEGSTR